MLPLINIRRSLNAADTICHKNMKPTSCIANVCNNNLTITPERSWTKGQFRQLFTDKKLLESMKTAIVPIIKNKAGNSSDKANYRPIALVTACSKIFESCLLIMLEKYLHTHDQQFGFKGQHATDMCIFTVKSVIKYYTKQNPSKQLGSETEAKFSRLQDVVPNIRRTVPICFHFFRYNFGTRNIEASLFQRSAFNLVRLILVKSV